jgi:hypothetical protein
MQKQKNKLPGPNGILSITLEAGHALNHEATG